MLASSGVCEPNLEEQGQVSSINNIVCDNFREFGTPIDGGYRDHKEVTECDNPARSEINTQPSNAAIQNPDGAPALSEI
jgi:hypothetical protein